MKKSSWMDFRVVDIISETHDTKTYILDPSLPFDYTPGQYLTFKFDSVGSKPVARSYTMSSAPSQGYSITVKQIGDGVVSNYLSQSLKIGDVLKARGPIGKFCYSSEDQDNLVLIAGGSGVTPFMSMLQEYKDKIGHPNCPKSIKLLVFYKTQEDIIFKKELETLKDVPGIEILISLTREESNPYLSGKAEDLLESTIQDTTNSTFMVCGPKPLMSSTIEHLKKRQVPQNYIKTESFE